MASLLKLHRGVEGDLECPLWAVRYAFVQTTQLRCCVASEVREEPKLPNAAITTNGRYPAVSTPSLSQSDAFALRQSDGVWPITRKNSRLKLDFVANPASKEISMIVFFDVRNCVQASRMRNSFTN